MFDGMITEDYSEMLNSNVGFQSFDYGDELGNDLGFLMRDQLSGERERGFFRSPSAPPTVEGSLSAAGELFFSPAATAVEGGGHNNRVVSEEELRCDPAYVDYYYSNVNLNPRLPPPLLSKEDWRFTRRVGGDGGGGGLGGIGDRRKLGKSWENGGQSSLVFSDALGFNGGKEGIDAMGQNEWGGDGLIGLPGLGLGSRKKSIAEIIQDDLNNSTSSSRIPSRPASRNAFDETISTPDTQFSPLQHELSSADDPRRGSNVQGLVGNQDTATGVSASLTYASALGTSLSRATTPDPQLVARAPSPRIPPVGEGRVNSIDKRGINGTTSLNGSSNISADLLSAFSGMNLSADNTINEKKQTQPHQNSYLNSYEFGSFQQKSVPHSTKGLYTGKTGGFMLDQNNYYSRTDGPVEFHKTGGPSSPLEYHSVGSPSSAIPDYSLSGHNINPALASMMASQLGNGTLPPLFENAAASAIGVGALDSRASRKNLTPPGKSAIDPFYLQYLGSSEYDPAMDGVNSYMDMLALQKAYLGALPSPQKSECGGPYVGRSGSLNHFYYGNPTFGIGSAYGGSPLVGSGPPVRQNERNMRLGSGIRNLGAGTGTWRSEAGAFMDQSFGSSLLDEFKSNKTRCFELLEISGHVVEFSADQYGSRFIQQKLETASMEEKNMVFHEIMPQVLSLMTDVFGNYVIQKFFEHGTASQIRELADKLTGHVLTLSLQMYGCRVIQKAIEVVELDQQKKMVVELDGHVMRCVRDQNGNHVIQKCIECIPEDAIQFIISTFYDQVVSLSTHPYGCRVIQRVLEHCHDPKTQRIVMDEIMHSVCMLAQDQYGNYVVQHVLEHGKPHERSAIICSLKGKIVKMSQQKFASNVIEKCLTFGDVSERRSMVNEMLGSTDDNEPLQVMMKDQFANYVVQKVLETCDDQQLELILSRIKNHLNALKKYTYGKHIVARVEKLVAAGERRISLQTPYAVQMA